jgi:hypothetical protein
VLARSFVIFLMVVCATVVQASIVTVAVPGTASPWLAGMPNGSTCCLVDSAPAQSPVLVPVTLIPGTVLTFSSVGTTKHGPALPLVDADGRPGMFTSKIGGEENGIADATAQLSSLMGVFLDANQPDLSPAPGGLNFSGAGGMDFLSLSPLLKQPFFIGNGLTAGAAVQEFVIPAGATRLFLGTMDGFEWNNNGGSLEVTISSVPEPSTLLLFGAGLVAVSFVRKRR